jgi:hypothetical protein
MIEPHFVSHYCERSAAGLWGEPVNALTNLAFLVAGIFAWQLYRHNRQTVKKPAFDLLILIILLFCIAIGSALWHTIAQPWAELADAIPILLFISVYLLSFLWRVLHLRTVWIILIFALFQVVDNAVIFAVPKDVLNGSLFYGPTWFTLLIFTLLLLQNRHPAAKSFVTATLLFSAALVFRTLDQTVCSVIPFGTHFMWHLLIAIVLYRVFSCLIRYP